MAWRRLREVVLGRHPPLQYVRRAVATPAPSSHDAPVRQLCSLSHVSQWIISSTSTPNPDLPGDCSSLSQVVQRPRQLHTSVHCATDARAASRPASQAVQRGPQADFQAQLDDGTLRSDPRQVAAIGLLQDVYIQLEKLYPRKKKPSNLTMLNNVSTKQSRAAWWSTLMRATDPPPGQGPQVDTLRAKGLYMWGGVGVGKTMLMDIFVRSTPKEFKVRRIHFHDLMIEVHSRLREYSGEQDPLCKVADKIAAHDRVLCLDELFVTDVADAVILERLFGRLWDQGLTVIATSNRHPTALYEGGLQRQLFVPFIHRLERECVVHDMDSVTDYRRLATSTVGMYFVRLVEGRSNDDRLAAALEPITEGRKQEAATVTVAMGRQLQVPRAWDNGVCWFKFEELFGAAVGAPDFIAVVSKFHTIALQGVPIFTAENRSMGYRFVTFMDIAYEHRTKVLMSAEGYPTDLFKQVMTLYNSKQSGQKVTEDVVVDDNLGFAKDRTISRLIEMQTIEYALAHSERNQPEMKLALEEAKSKLAN